MPERGNAFDKAGADVAVEALLDAVAVHFLAEVSRDFTETIEDRLENTG